MLYFLLSILHGQECDFSELTAKSSTEGADIPGVFFQMQECDPQKSRQHLPKLLSQYSYNELGIQDWAFLSAIVQLREYAPFYRWLNDRILDERQQILSRLGEECLENEAIREFFLHHERTSRSSFWLDRWDIPLRSCPHTDIVALLYARISKDIRQGDSRFWGVLTSYAIVAREQSIPVLVKQIESISPAQRERYFDIFTHIMIAAESEEESASLLATIKAAIFSLSILSEGDMADQARQFFLQFGDLDSANRMARFRYHQALQEDYALIWGGEVIESVVCANNIARQNIHTVLLIDTKANKWSKQIEKKLPEIYKNWGISLSKECNGKGHTEFFISSGPFLLEQDFEKWTMQKKRLAHPIDVVEGNRKKIRHDPVGLE